MIVYESKTRQGVRGLFADGKLVAVLNEDEDAAAVAKELGFKLGERP